MSTMQNTADAVSQVYARAITELASSKGGGAMVESVHEELAAIVEMARTNARFGEFLASRIISASQKKASLATIFKGRCNELTLNFLMVLCDAQRLNKLRGIMSAMEDAIRSTKNLVEVKVTTAAPLSDGEVGALKTRIAGALSGKQPVIKTYTDPSMIGGIRLQVGDQLLDGSVAARLRQVRDQLASNGLPQVRSAADRIVAAS